MDGSIRPVGDKLRVSVRLVTPETEESKWAASLARRVTANPEAYDAYLKGNFYYAQRSATFSLCSPGWIAAARCRPTSGLSAWTGTTSRRTIGDPGFFVPYRGFAWIAAVRGSLTEARALLDTAIAMAPQSVDAFAERARLSLLLGDPAGAERHVATARNMGMSPRNDWIEPMLEGAKGNPAAARAWLRARPNASEGVQVGLLYAIGAREEAFRILERKELPAFDLIRGPTWGRCNRSHGSRPR